MQIATIEADNKVIIYVNALSETDSFAHSIYILAGNRRTGEEQIPDCVLPNDKIGTCFDVIHQVLGHQWSLLDSWVLQEPCLAIEIAA